MNPYQPTTLTATVSGTLLVVMMQINNNELMKTAVLAAIGAVVSFIVSKAMKHLWEKIKNKRSRG